MNEENNIKVYYNSACPVCKVGIHSQQNKKSECKINWNDVHSNNKFAEEVSNPLETVRERLHVLDEHNELQIGIEAFITLWRHSTHEHWKATLFSMPLINPLANIGYNCFARILYKWNRKQGNW